MTRPALLVATGNAGKLAEIRQMLGELPVTWASLGQYPELQLPEEGDDYAPNAIAKAVTAARAAGCIAVADDSGLEVRGLAGRPGPHSARYGGPGLDDRGRVEHLLREMAALVGEDRRARFVCHAAVATPDGASETALGLCEGRIATTPRGDQGFGYDPVFFADECQQIVAELSDVEKNRLSHRGRAFEALRPAIERALARCAPASD